jgi:hypothetical protein
MRVPLKHFYAPSVFTLGFLKLSKSTTLNAAVNKETGQLGGPLLGSPLFSNI